MGSNRFDTTFTESSDIDADHVKQYAVALNGDIVPRVGDVPAEGPNLGTRTLPWNTAFINSLNVNGESIDFATVPRLRNYAVPPTGATTPTFMGIDTTTNMFTLAAGSKFVISGEEVTVSSEIQFNGVAPINRAGFNQPLFTISNPAGQGTFDRQLLTSNPLAGGSKDVILSVIGNQDFIYNYSSAYRPLSGSIVILPQVAGHPDPGALAANSPVQDGQLIGLTAPATAVGNQEIAVGRYHSGLYVFTEVERGIGILADGSHSSEYAIGSTLQDYVKIGWVFLDSSGLSVEVTHTEPLGHVPTSGNSGEYAYNPLTQQWNRHDGTTWQAVKKLLIGRIFLTDSGPLAYDPVQYGFNYSWENTIELVQNDHIDNISVNITKLTPRNPNSYCSVYGRAIPAAGISFTPTSITTSSGDRVYFYISISGSPFTSLTRPILDHQRKGHYHPSMAARCVGSLQTANGTTFTSGGANTYISEKYLGETLSAAERINTTNSFYRF